MIHEITRNEITQSNTNVSCQFVTLVRVVSWIAIVYSKKSAQENKKLTVCYADSKEGGIGNDEIFVPASCCVVNCLLVLLSV